MKVLSLAIAGIYLWLEVGVSASARIFREGKSPRFEVPIELAENTESSSSETEEESEDESPLKPFDEVTKDLEKIEGLLTFYRNVEKEEIYLEIQPEQLDRNFLAIATISSGIGSLGLYRGLPLSDFIFQFKRRNHKIDVVVPNTLFRTQAGDPQWRSRDRSFSDSPIYTLPLTSIHPERNSLLVDFKPFLMGEGGSLSTAIAWSLGDMYTLNSETSYLDRVQVFPENAEIETVYGFSGPTSWFGPATVPDSRAFQLKIRTSLSLLPTNNGYRPRLADDRLGYFLTTYQNLSNSRKPDPFVNYINRWHLEKQDPSAPLSPPKQPIVFWIDNAVPLPYRDAIREGILMWNDAFEQAGFIGAIEARQMPDRPDWDPADVRYNVIVWSNTLDSWFAGIGPSRVNPLTGEILDADVILDGGIVRQIREQYGALADGDRALVNPLTCELGAEISHFVDRQLPSPIAAQLQQSNPASLSQLRALAQIRGDRRPCFALAATNQARFGALALSTLHDVLPNQDEMELYVHQFVRWLTAHEVGHVLGLRHNFQGSTWRMPEDLNNVLLTRNEGMVGSVMDYVAVNIAPEGVEQGDYFPVIVGPYDRWVVEYGYRPIDAPTPELEWDVLQEIARRAPQPGLEYATDEDSMDLVYPDSNLWDLSGDPLRYSQWQMDNARQVWDKLDRRYPLPGESYSELRDRFHMVLNYYFGYAYDLTRYIGGQRFHRHHAGDPGAKPPFEAIAVERQREALAAIGDRVFAEDAFNFSPETIARLAPDRWDHWGNWIVWERLDYPLFDRLLGHQTLILSNLLSTDRLNRLRDGELSNPNGDSLRLGELFETLQAQIWSELSDDRDPRREITVLRRGLQREHLNMLLHMALRTNIEAAMEATSFLDLIIALRTLDPPEDARALARYQLRDLHAAIDRRLDKEGKRLDVQTRAHLEEARDRIAKALEAPMRAKEVVHKPAN
ncbi:MAG: DUF5117 domain-containing protein [Cyanobacteria bacterium J007]|nr:MAG: DUF5117 domain-containing protein [Cyanobacteria bacterium J007]